MKLIFKLLEKVQQVLGDDDVELMLALVPFEFVVEQISNQSNRARQSLALEVFAIISWNVY